MTVRMPLVLSIFHASELPPVARRCADPVRDNQCARARQLVFGAAARRRAVTPFGGQRIHRQRAAQDMQTSLRVEPLTAAAAALARVVAVSLEGRMIRGDEAVLQTREASLQHALEVRFGG